MNAVQIKSDIISNIDKLYTQLKKDESVLDSVYALLCNINYDDEHFIKETISKVISKIEELNEVNFKEVK